MRSTRLRRPRDAVRHNAPACEHPGCQVHFSIVRSRHHCRQCGMSVCDAHFVRPLCNACLGRATADVTPLIEQGLDAEAPPPPAEEAEAPPGGSQDVEMVKDVYATAFMLANNATPGMYSFMPWKNRDMLLVWFYLIFIACSQIFVLVSLLCIFPPAVDGETFFVDCDQPSAEAAAALNGSGAPALATVALEVLRRLVAGVGETATADGGAPADAPLSALASLLGIGAPAATEAGPSAAPADEAPALSASAMARCLAEDALFDAYAPGSDDLLRYRRVEVTVFFYQNIFHAGQLHLYVLQAICCIWVTVHVYFVDLRQVARLLLFRDFNRWLLPQKGEELMQNGWVMAIPLLQFVLGSSVVAVSCCVTCGFVDAIDIVLNSLAFTFISRVAELFNEPLLRYYETRAIQGLGAEYGTEPIYYLVSEYSDQNAYGATYREWIQSWYIRDSDALAGLLTDFKFRHTPGSYPQPNLRRIQRMKRLFLFVPPLSVLLCWALFTPF